MYSLGCTLYKLLAGQPPFGGEDFSSSFEKMTAHAFRPPPPIREQRPEIPESLAGIVDRLLSKEPEGRYASGAELAAALEPLAEGNNLAAHLQEVLARMRDRIDLPEESPGEGIAVLGSGPAPDAAQGPGGRGARLRRFWDQWLGLRGAGHAAVAGKQTLGRDDPTRGALPARRVRRRLLAAAGLVLLGCALGIAWLNWPEDAVDGSMASIADESPIAKEGTGGEGKAAAATVEAAAEKQAAEKQGAEKQGAEKQGAEKQAAEKPGTSVNASGARADAQRVESRRNERHDPVSG